MSEGGNKMGASKEGKMGVRDKINAVLQEFLEEDGSSPSSSSPLENKTCYDPTGGGGVCSSSTAGVPTTVSVAVNCKVADLIRVSSESCIEMSPRGSRVSGGDVIVEGSGGMKGGGGSGQHSYDKEDAAYIVMQNLLKQQLRLIGSLNSRLSSTESKWKEVSRERDQLQVALEHERQHSAKIQSESDVIIRDQEAKIRELQKQLAEATFIKPKEDKATCVTPPPPQPPSPPPPPSTPPMPSDNMWDDMDITSPPLHKRPRKDIMMGQPETNSRFLSPPSQNTFLSPPASSSHLSGTNSGRNPSRLSTSPPQLSPVVTPKSALKTLGRPRDSRSYLGQHFQDAGDDSLVGGPTDEFQDELAGIHSGGRSHHEQNTDTSAYHQHHHPPVSLSSQQGSSSKTSSSSYSSTSLTPYFSQAPSFLNKSRHTRFMFPDGKKRFVPNTSSDSSFQPVNKSSTVSSLPNSHSNSYSAQYDHHSSSNAIRNRSNNFLNLNRPLMKKAPVGIIIPPPHQHQNQQSQMMPSSSSSFHFRSLDLDGMTTDETAAASASHESQHRQLPEETASVPSITPPPTGVVKKRKVGRPPGSGMKSKRIQPVPSTPKSPGPGPSPSGQIANGSVNSQQDSQTTPQKFSQRGRLLKPNRARYSPDPDISIPTPTREKFVTTKKGYFVGQPFIHEMEYSSEQGHEDDEEVFDVGNRQGPPTTCTETEVDDEGLPQGRPSVQTSSSAGIFDDGGDGGKEGATGAIMVVEVPQWRISIVEGFSDDEERIPNEDDMSDEAFLKRHQKLEQKEKQRKRWDSQRMREESYLERLKRKQEERERQKELRRQQRKRKGRLGTSEEESVTPSVEEIKAIHIGSELPVGAFGHPLPLVEKVDFDLVWKTVPASTTPTTEVPPPAPPTTESKSSPPLVPQEISLVPDEDVPKLSTSTDSIEPVLAQGIPVVLQQTKEACLSGASSPFTAVPSLSSPSSSSLSLPSIPSPCNSPPPPVIFPVFDEDSIDAPIEPHDENVIEPTSTVESMETEEDTGILVVENEPEKLDSDGEEDSDPDSPVYSVDLADYVSEPELMTSEGASDTEETTAVTPEPAESCDLQTIPVSATPSISIPLRSPGSPKVAHHATTVIPTPESATTTDTNTTTLNGSSEQKTKCSTVVHFPQIASLTAVFSQANSSALRSVPSVTPISTSTTTVTSTSGVSKTSITFFIPNNPLAPRHHHHSSSTSTSKRTTHLVVPSSLSSEFSMEKSDS